MNPKQTENAVLLTVVWGSNSARHRLHLLPPHLYDGAVETMDHFIDGSTPLSFARQTSFDSSVAFLLLRWVNECL